MVRCLWSLFVTRFEYVVLLCVEVCLLAPVGPKDIKNKGKKKLENGALQQLMIGWKHAGLLGFKTLVVQ